MLTKAYIEQLKQENIPELYKLLDFKLASSQQILFILENLGKLPPNFNGDFLLLLFQNATNSNVQYWAIKNIAKLADYSFLEFLLAIVNGDYDSQTRREATSAIGRMRDRRNIPYLIALLQDTDPNIVLQAIRGLIVFKGHLQVDEALAPFKTHPNENIQMIVQKEYRVNTGIKSEGHTQFPSELKNAVVLGDVMEILPVIPDESIHLTFTSPPYYNARDYSIYPSYQHYLDFLRGVFREVHRVTKEGRFCVINTSPVIVPRISRAHSSKRYPIPFDIHYLMMQQDWEFVDDIVWVKPESSVKNRNGGFQQHRKPLGYKPNAFTEYLMVYRKKTDKLLDWNMRQYPDGIIEKSKVNNGFETSNVWRIDPTFDKVHSAVFPIELCNRVVQYYSYIGDLVFDPFAGSGTLGKSALDLERAFLLTEQHPPYFERIKDRLKGQIISETSFLSLEELKERVKQRETH